MTAPPTAPTPPQSPETVPVVPEVTPGPSGAAEVAAAGDRSSWSTAGPEGRRIVDAHGHPLGAMATPELARQVVADHHCAADLEKALEELVRLRGELAAANAVIGLMSPRTVLALGLPLTDTSAPKCASEPGAP